MRRRTLSIILFSLWVLSACAAPTPVSFTPTDTPTLIVLPSATATPLPSEATETPAPTRTAIPSNTSVPLNGSPTPQVPTVLSANGKDVQCYLGPGMEYAPTFTFKAAEIVGKDKAGLWWYIQTYDKLAKPIFCWVNTQDASTAGNIANIPVTEAEKASVTAVNISIDGNSTQEVACGQDTAKPEFRFNGEIVTNGPVDKLRYQWMTDVGDKFSPEQTQIRAWDAPARFEFDISVPAQEGTYSLVLRTISPNEMVRAVQFVVKCR